jgi:SpoVK/Ycf46/Vps4 family AAA+-type ATPase
MDHEENIKALQEAVACSPGNVPLRRHLAEVLLKAGRNEEAEAQFREAMALAPDDMAVKFGLARTFFRNGKHREAMVLVEGLCQKPGAPAEALILWCRLLHHEGNAKQAVQAYRNAIAKDQTLRDESLEQDLGIDGASEEVVDGKVRLAAGAGNEPDPQLASIERPRTSFADVGGMEELKETIRLQIIHPLNHPEMYKAFGKAIGGGILLYGPPGCGKTHLARAVAGEIKAGFISIGIQDILEMWVGSSERNLHEVFESARGNKPCVLFFDEVDALASRRSDMKNSASRQTINQFLAELDGTNVNNDGVLILAATNAPWHIDTAFRRPGRFDRIVFVPPPDPKARCEVFRILLKGKPMSDIDIDHLAKKTDQYSGADVGAVINLAVEEKLQASLKTGQLQPLTTADILNAIKRHKPTTKEWFLSAKNHALYANQGGLYDGVLEYLNIRKP